MGLINKVLGAVHEYQKKKKRSPKWPAVEKAFLKLNANCAACGSTTSLQVHHIKPFSNFPALELEHTNLLALCMGTFDCHLKIGHGGAFKFYNPNVIEDARESRAFPDRRKLVVYRAAVNRKD